MIPINHYLPSTSRIVLGCMGFGGGWNNEPITKSHIQEMHEAIDAALDVGINFLDHADIYTLGKAEQVFAKVIQQRPELAEQLVIQTKCGIRFGDTQGRPNRYDFSAEWIKTAVNDSLTRLNVEQVDVLMLHRPDPLMEAAEVAEVLHELHNSGKIKNVAVSNMHMHQITWLQQHLDLPIIANQLEMSLLQHDFISEGLLVGMKQGADHHFSLGLLEYSQTQNMQIQAWGSLAKGLFSGASLDNQPQNVIDTAQTVARLAAEYGTNQEAIVLAWLMRHPAQIQPVIGTTNPDRIRASGKSAHISLEREHWYELLKNIRGVDVP